MEWHNEVVGVRCGADGRMPRFCIAMTRLTLRMAFKHRYVLTRYNTKMLTTIEVIGLV